MTPLTRRQNEVLALMMQGKNNKAIGRALGLAEPTVKHHVTAVLKALKVTTRTEAVLAVAGRIPPAPSTASSSSQYPTDQKALSAGQAIDRSIAIH